MEKLLYLDSMCVVYWPLQMPFVWKAVSKATIRVNVELVNRMAIVGWQFHCVVATIECSVFC